MNGFTIQQTDFPFVCCIVDDASTDGEQKKILNYVEDNFDYLECSKLSANLMANAHVIYAQHKTNKNCYFVVMLLNENHYSRKISKRTYLNEWIEGIPYEAICEGDDYWIDKNKIQKQADYLDTHPNVGLIRTNCHKYIQKSGNLITDVFSKPPYNKVKDTFRDYLIYGWWAATCTWMYRRKYRPLIEKNSQNMPHSNKRYFLGDTFLLLSIAQVSDVYYLSDSTTVYRVLENSASHFLDRKSSRAFARTVLNTRLFFARKSPIPYCAILYRYYRRSVLLFVKDIYNSIIVEKKKH